MKKLIALVFTAAAGLLSTGGALASDVYWSIGINAPVVGAVVSNVPHHGHGAPVYYPAPVYGPPAVVYRAAPRYVSPRPIYYQPAPVIIVPRHGHRHGWHKRQGHRGGHGVRHDNRRGHPAHRDQRRHRH